jgi:tetratricopeptide (TPR) repeat protein
VSLRSSPRALSAALAAVLVVQLAPPTAARADGGTTSVQTVESLTNQAFELTAAGKYSEAIGAYMKAYEISKAGAVLYNIATIYDRRMHERALAMEYFRRYLQATDADAEFARRATERLSALKAEEAAEAKMRSAVRVEPPPPAPPPPAPLPPDLPPPSKPSPLRPAGLVIGAIGLAGVGVGLGLGAAAMSKNNDANQSCGAISCSTSQGFNAEHQAGTFATESTVLFATGATLLVLGVTLFLAAPHGRPATSIAIAPGASSSGGGLSVAGTF